MTSEGAASAGPRHYATRALGTLLLLVSLVFTVPIALWVTVAVVAAVMPLEGPVRVDYWWADYLGWAVMLAVIGATFWGLYRLWEPFFEEDSE